MGEILSNQELNDLLWDCCEPGVMTYRKANVVKASHEALRGEPERLRELLRGAYRSLEMMMDLVRKIEGAVDPLPIAATYVVIGKLYAELEASGETQEAPP